LIKNVPVPPRTYDLSWLTENVENLRPWRTLQFLNRALRKVGAIRDASQSTESVTGDTREHTKKVIRKIFDDLKHHNEKKFSRLVLVFFPLKEEVTSEGPREWIEFIEAESKDQGIILIDLFDDFQSLPHKEVVKMFREDRHFTERGNEFVASLLYEKLSNHPELSKVFSLNRHN
jgi:hypothetical protein